MADRILTTHAGSLPRPDDLADMVWARMDGEDVDEAALEAKMDEAVVDLVAKQREVGLDVISDGEMRRTSWIGTARGSVEGFEGRPGGPGWQWQGTAEAAELSTRPFPFVVRPISFGFSLADREYAFLRRHAHARTKFCVPAPATTAPSGIRSTRGRPTRGARTSWSRCAT